MDKTTTKRKLPILKKLLPFLVAYPLHTAGAALALVFTALGNLVSVQGVRYVIDEGFIAQSSTALNHGILAIIGLIVLVALGTYCRFFLVSWLGERISADLRQAVFDHVITLDPYYFELNRSGEIMSRLTTDTSLLQNIIGSSASMALRSFLMVLGGIVMMFVTNIKLSIVVLICVPLLLVPISLFGRQVRTLSRKSQDAIADMGTQAGEVIQQIKTVQSYVRETLESENFRTQVETTFKVSINRIKQRAFLIVVVMILVFCAIAGMLWIGGNDVLSGKMSGGELSAFVIYAVMVAMGVATIAEVLGELQRAAGATERLIELLEEKPTITQLNRNNTPTVPQKELDGSISADDSTHIIFKHVSFNYPSRPNDLALNDLSFTLEDGKSMALVGPSGAGKSTIFELLLRFYDPQGGSIELGGKDIRQISPADLRHHIAVVPQQPALFSADVNYNIGYGKPAATEEQIVAAAKAAHAHDFIIQLPDGYKSYLGEQGVRLSGGQKQRIAIARAILKNPKILLLDEATSALDSESEQHVQAAIQEIMKNRTTIIIAHRLSTVQHVDKIGVLEKGRLIALDTHNQLIKKSELYARLHKIQFKENVL